MILPRFDVTSVRIHWPLIVPRVSAPPMNATPTSIQVLSVPNLEFHITLSSVSPVPLSCDMDELCSEMTLCYCHPVFLIDQIHFDWPNPTHFRTSYTMSRRWKEGSRAIWYLQLADFYTTHQNLMQALRITYIDQPLVSSITRSHVILTIPRSIRVKNQQLLQVLEILSRWTARESSEGELAYVYGMREELMVPGWFSEGSPLGCYATRSIVSS